MLKVNFYLKTEKLNKNGESCIYVKIKLKNEITTLSTGKYISRKRWRETDRLRKTLKVKKEQVIKDFLEIRKEQIERVYYELYKIDSNLNIIQVKNKLKGVSQDCLLYTSPSPRDA